MFSRAERDAASKVALVHLVARLIAGGYRMLDAQFMTAHLTQFGAQEISRLDYHRRLAQAISAEAGFHRRAGATGGAAALQVISRARHRPGAPARMRAGRWGVHPSLEGLARGERRAAGGGRGWRIARSHGAMRSLMASSGAERSQAFTVKTRALVADRAADGGVEAAGSRR